MSFTVRADDMKPGMVTETGVIRWTGRSAENPDVVAVHYDHGLIVSKYGGLHPDTPVEVMGWHAK